MLVSCIIRYQSVRVSTGSVFSTKLEVDGRHDGDRYFVRDYPAAVERDAEDLSPVVSSPCLRPTFLPTVYASNF